MASGSDEAYCPCCGFPRSEAAEPIEKTLRSAVANAREKADRDGEMLDTDELFVKEAYVNEGPRLKRWRAAAMGRAAPRVQRRPPT